VITGLIKANIPTRIAFQVSSRIDSRTILDQMGAEHLLGHGDMLYLPPGTSIPQRAHGAFVDDHEVHQVVHYLRQTGQPDYIADITQDPGEAIPGLSPEAAGVDVEDADPLFDQAVQIVTDSRRASISGVQRRLKVGYNRAARLVEEMERIGIVSGPDRNGNRTVLAPGSMGE
jgi:S-DNA-T family DNA segregation ATPase FtsK/SpoIIIE